VNQVRLTHAAAGQGARYSILETGWLSSFGELISTTRGPEIKAPPDKPNQGILVPDEPSCDTIAWLFESLGITAIWPKSGARGDRRKRQTTEWAYQVEVWLPSIRFEVCPAFEMDTPVRS